MKGASSFVSSILMKLSCFVTGEVELKSGFRDGTGRCTYLVHRGNQIHFVHVDQLKGTGCNPSFGSVAGCRERSRLEESVESHAVVKYCLVFPDRTKSWESCCCRKYRRIASTTETQESVLGDALQGTSTPGSPLNTASV